MSLEKLGYIIPRLGGSIGLKPALLALFLSLSPTDGCNQQNTCSVNDSISYSLDGLPSSIILDNTPVLKQSLLYYHIARNDKGVFDVCERSERVVALTDRIYAAAREVNMPDDIAEQFRGLIFSESAGDSLATSSVGAKGVAQIMKTTAGDFGGYYWKNHRLYDKRIDVDWSLQTAAKLLAFEYQTFGDWSLAFAAYHLGHGNMRTLRTLYKETMGTELCSMDQLYVGVPSKEVIDWLASKKDDTFGYLPKIYNAVTLLRIYEQEPEYFRHLEQQYVDIPYDVRGIVAENVIFGSNDYLCHQDDVSDAIRKELLVSLDHDGFVCGKYPFENFLNPRAVCVLDDLEGLYGSRPLITCGLLDNQLTGEQNIHVNKQQKLRLGSHTTGMAFDLKTPKNTIDAKGNVIGSSQYNRLEYVLTLLRYQGKIIWCRETDPDRKTVQQFHVVVLPPEK